MSGCGRMRCAQNRADIASMLARSASEEKALSLLESCVPHLLHPATDRDMAVLLARGRAVLLRARGMRLRREPMPRWDFGTKGTHQAKSDPPASLSSGGTKHVQPSCVQTMELVIQVYKLIMSCNSLSLPMHMGILMRSDPEYP